MWIIYFSYFLFLHFNFKAFGSDLLYGEHGDQVLPSNATKASCIGKTSGKLLPNKGLFKCTEAHSRKRYFMVLGHSRSKL